MGARAVRRGQRELMAVRCPHCDGSGILDIEDGRITYGGSPSGHSITCHFCRGTGARDGRVERPEPTPASGGCISQLVGWVVGWIVLGIIAIAVFAALVFVPRLFTDHGDGTGLASAENGQGYPANHQVGNCYPHGSWVAARCDGPHESELYALVYIDAAPGSPYPPERDLIAFGRENCQPQFETYAAGTPGDLGVILGEVYPSVAEWDAGIRQVLCGAIGVDGTTLSAALPRS